MNISKFRLFDDTRFEQLAVELEVSKVWKGPSYETIFVSTSPSGASCGFSFTVAREYLVYSHRDETTPEVSICSRTKQLAEAQEDFEELEEGHTPEPGSNAPKPNRTGRLPIVGGCGLSPYPGSAPNDVSGLGLMVGLVWFGLHRRPG